MPLPTRRMLTKEEAADYCGFKSVNGFLGHIRVSPIKFGSNVRYDRVDLDAYLDGLREPSAHGELDLGDRLLLLAQQNPRRKKRSQP
jgi:hypothetical protein